MKRNVIQVFMRSLRNNWMIKLLVLANVVLVIGIVTQMNTFSSRPEMDCLVIEQLGMTLWSHGLDDNLEARDLRAKSGQCGFPPSYWEVTPMPTPTFSVGCIDNSIAYIQSGGEEMRVEAAINGIEQCLDYWSTATMSAPGAVPVDANTMRQAILQEALPTATATATP